MPTNTEAAELFQGIADILDVQGEKFKPEAYRRAARSIESLTEDLSAVAARDELRTIPGVGEAIEEKLKEYLDTGKLDYYERLRKEVPPGILEMLAIPGLGPKTARRFWQELKVETPAQLADAIQQGRLNGLSGFGPKKISQIRDAVAAAQGVPAATRLPIELAFPIALRLAAGLREVRGVKECEIAGSFRRRRESVGDLDILVTVEGTDRESVFDAFSGLPDVRDVRLRGGTKETVILTNGLQVDLRIVAPEEFGAALLYFTGSKDHNVILRSLARDRGLKINEYAVTRGDERVGGRTEDEMYGALGLAWIPPELRENHGEVEAAAKGPLPPLIESRDLTGDLHCHLHRTVAGGDMSPREFASEVDRIASTARARKLGYAGVVVAAVDANGAPQSVADGVHEHVGRADSPSLRLGRVVEVDGAGIPKEFSEVKPAYVILRPTRAHPDPPEPAISKKLAATVVAHVGNDPAGRKWVAWAKAHGAAIEVGPGAERLDSTSARGARESGVSLVVPTGIDRPADDPTGAVALGFARRAAAGPGAVRNAAKAAEITGGWPKRAA
jgi:DNA polymerase/3'-5' exonuclease PolX